MMQQQPHVAFLSLSHLLLSSLLRHFAIAFSPLPDYALRRYQSALLRH